MLTYIDSPEKLLFGVSHVRALVDGPSEMSHGSIPVGRVFPGISCSSGDSPNIDVKNRISPENVELAFLPARRESRRPLEVHCETKPNLSKNTF